MILKRIVSDGLFWAAFFAALFVIYGFHLFIETTPFEISSLGLAHLLTLILISPFLEEAAFRGWLQGLILKGGWSQKTIVKITIANILTSALFSLLHIFGHSITWAFAVFFPSLVFGFFRDRYGSIQASVVLHVWYNFAYFVILPAM